MVGDLVRGTEPGGNRMSIDDKLRSAVKPLVPDIAPDLYLGNKDEYCPYNYEEMPDGFGDNTAM